MSNPSILLRVAAVVLATQVGMTAAHAALVNGQQDSVDFSDGDATGTIYHAVLFNSAGVTEARFKNATGFGGTFAADATVLNDTDDNIDGEAYDETAPIVFLYQLEGTDAASKIEDLLIKSFGFTPSSMGFISGYHLDDAGAITQVATDENPSSSESEGLINNEADAFRFDAFGAASAGIGNNERSSIVYATFATDSGVSSESAQIKGDNNSVRVDLPSPNPEPGSLALLGAAVAGFGGFRRFRRRRSAEQRPEDSEADTDSTPELD